MLRWVTHKVIILELYSPSPICDRQMGEGRDGGPIFATGFFLPTSATHSRAQPPGEQRQLVAGGRCVAAPVHGFDDEGVYAVGGGVDEVLVHPGRDGQGTQHTVDVDLI